MLKSTKKVCILAIICCLSLFAMACGICNKPIERTKIVLGTDDLLAVSTLVRQFNQSNRDYYIEIVEYGYQKDKSIDDLRVELESGTAPDILAMAHCLSDKEINNPNHYADLMEYFIMDGEFNEQCIVPSVLNSMLESGTLIWLPNEFMIHTYTARASIVGDRQSVTAREASGYAEALGEEYEVFPCSVRATRLLKDLSVLTVASVEVEDGACRFIDLGFADTLNLCVAHKEAEIEDVDADDFPDQCVLHYCPIWNTASAAQQRFLWDGDYCYVGFPSEVCNGSYFSSSGVSFAINAYSVNDKGAWEFIKYVLSDTNQANVTGFPVMQSALEQDILEAVDRNELEEVDVDKLLTLIEETEVYMQPISSISDIVYSVGEKILLGAQSMDSAVAEIQASVKGMELCRSSS